MERNLTNLRCSTLSFILLILKNLVLTKASTGSNCHQSCVKLLVEELYSSNLAYDCWGSVENQLFCESLPAYLQHSGSL
jgi:hypothetical protein